ncbi:P-loop NTPase family protein [Aquirufa sp. TARAVU-A1A]
MSNKENLKPLSLDSDDAIKPLELNRGQDIQSKDDFVPITKGANNQIQNKDSHFVFFFGVSASGKSVILSSILYYLSSQAGVLSPKVGTPNSKEAQVLLADFFENMSKGILPNRTTRDQVTRIDLKFEPNNRSKKVPPINLTFLETAGANHQDINKGNQYHTSIDNYLNAKIPLNIIIVTSYDSAHKEDSLINQFLNRLVEKNIDPQYVNIILVISKWDLSGKSGVASEDELESFISERLPMTNNRINAYEFSKTYFTIGKIEEKGNTEKITNLNLDSAEIISKWLYEGITGYPLDYEGTFWERIKFNF